MQTDHWSNYWARGCLTSLPQDFQANYDGEIAAFWRRQFAALPLAAHILDVCTGNGAIALLAAEYGRAHERSFEISAVDAARIDPAAVARQHPACADLVQAIRFFGQCPFETLECAGLGFDLIVSQYGLEYCDWEQAAAKAAQLLKPGGALAMVSHDSASDVLKTMAAEQAEYARLIDLKILPALEAFGRKRIGPVRLRSVMKQAMPALRQDFGQSGSPLYRYVLEIAEWVIAGDDRAVQAAAANLDQAAGQLGDGYRRLHDVLRVGRALAENPDWHRVFAGHGLIMREQGELHHGGQHRAGHYYCYGKPA